MKSWTKILASFLFFAGTAYAQCGFHPHIKSVYALSGNIASTLKALGLLYSPVVKGISVFYLDPDFKGEKVPGGVFLSPGKLSSMKDAIIYYDESSELARTFRSAGVKGREVKTRNLTPAAAVEKGILALQPVLSGCEKEIKNLKNRVAGLEEEIISRMKEPFPVIFFLGKVNEGKLPDLIMANDGIVLWLREKKLIHTYPSELSYVSWSMKIMGELPKKTIYLGLEESVKPELQGRGRKLNLRYPGVLVPGVTQLEAWKFFLDNYFQRKATSV